MEFLRTLEQLNNSLTARLFQVESSSLKIPFIGKDADRQLRKLTLNIKKEFKTDYSVPLKFREKEKERLEKIFADYLLGKSDDFNSHYIQLLAWNLIDLKVMNSKKFGRQSVFEYSPNPLAPYTVVEKTFRLFQNKRIASEKISFALILNYLNNYKIASSRYKNELKKYLRSIRFSDDLDVYFNVNSVVKYTIMKTAGIFDIDAPYPERLVKLKIKQRTLDTVYFSDVWFLWMLNYADLTDKNYVLKNLNCSFFKICSENKQKILLAKIIYDNNLSLLHHSAAEDVCLKYIFPLIKKENPFKKDYWNLDYTIYKNYKNYLESAWSFIEQTFVKNKAYKNMINFEERK